MRDSNEESETLLSAIIDRTTFLVIGLLVLFTPAVLLVITMSFLLFAESLELGQLSMLELVEFYLIELAIVAAFGYLLYRTMMAAVEHHLPEVIDRLEASNERRDEPPKSSASSRPDSGEENPDRR